MNQAMKDAKVDLLAERNKLSEEFYKAGMRYLIALDEWIESQPESKTNKELKVARERRQLLETVLHRFYPDEFADTSSAAE